MMGFPKIGNNGLGTKSVKGLSLVPNPAPSTNAVRIRGAMNGLQRREGVRGVQEVQEHEPETRSQDATRFGPPDPEQQSVRSSRRRLVLFVAAIVFNLAQHVCRQSPGTTSRRNLVGTSG